MNDRIKEFAMQATETIEIVNPDTGITHHREFFDNEKFAELIVLECAQAADKYVRYGEIDIAVIIKRHFGIKE